jgi:hypothetical protein
MSDQGGIFSTSGPLTPSGGSSGGLSGGQLLGLGGGAAAVGGLGYLLSQGPSPLPSQYGQLTGQQVPILNQDAATYNAEAAAMMQTGAGFTAQGQDALRMAQSGALTPEQSAALQQTKGGLENSAQQMYAGMGRNINQDTSGISTEADIAAKTTAMGQEYIKSTIALGLGEVGAGAQFSGLGAQFSGLSLQATGLADQALIEAGKAQLQQNQTYTSALSGAFGALGAMAPGLIKSMGPLLAA